jgi:hypothetical protein
VRAVVAAGAVALVVVIGAAGSNRRSSAVFSVDAQQASEVATVVTFLRAYNAGKLTAALAVVTPDVVGSDCDYRRRKAILFSGKKAFAGWLRARFADRDRLTLARVWNENRSQGLVVGVDYARRESLTLRALGATGGIKPQTASKIIFTSAWRIRSFANGPGGAPPDEQARICTP